MGNYIGIGSHSSSSSGGDCALVLERTFRGQVYNSTRTDRLLKGVLMNYDGHECAKNSHFGGLTRSATGGILLYFAYGSNLCTARLRYRVPGCRFAFVARLPNYRLCFHKRSDDGSAKCNAFKTAMVSDAVIGTVYEIPMNEKAALDRAEGLGRGYHEEMVRVLSAQGKEITVCTYIADAAAIDDALQPYSWYKDFVLAGAEEHQLPLPYVESRIRVVHAIPDPDPQREQARRAEIKP
jgi:hypothetical protein